MTKTIEDRIQNAVLLRGIANDPTLAADPEARKKFIEIAKKIAHCNSKLSCLFKSGKGFFSKSDLEFLRENGDRFESLAQTYLQHVAARDKGGDNNVASAAELLSELSDPTRQGEVDRKLVKGLKSLNPDQPVFEIDTDAFGVNIFYKQNLSQLLAKKN